MSLWNRSKQLISMHKTKSLQILHMYALYFPHFLHFLLPLPVLDSPIFTGRCILGAFLYFFSLSILVRSIPYKAIIWNKINLSSNYLVCFSRVWMHLLYKYQENNETGLSTISHFFYKNHKFILSNLSTPPMFYI